MENIHKGLTVPKWVLIICSKITHIPQNVSAHFVCRSPKVRDFIWLWSVMTDHLSLKLKCFSRDSPFLCHFYSKAELFFPGFFSDFSQILRIRIRTENNFPHNVSNHISSTQDKIYLHTHHWKISHFSSHFNQMKLFFVSQFLMCSLS